MASEDASRKGLLGRSRDVSYQMFFIRELNGKKNKEAF
jgi:hypothetical protein